MRHPKIEKGCIEGDCESGFGIYIDYEEKRYEGHWKDGNKNGFGKIYFKTGTLLYEGEWKNDERNGKGISYFFDHIEYEGEWKEGCWCGCGVLYFLGEINIKYEGEFYKKEFYGQGTLYYENGQVAYTGDWKAGKRNGQGTYFHENGNIEYEGQWKNDNRHGKGVSYYKDGQTKYIGEWSNGQRHGEGTEYLANDEFDGFWEFATVIPTSPDHWAIFQQIKYIGSWLNGKRHGEGTEYFTRDDWNRILFPQGEANRPLPPQQRAEKYQQIKYKGLWHHDNRTDNRIELNKQIKLLEFIDKYEQYCSKIFFDTFEVKADSYEIFRNLEDCNSPLLKAYIKRALPEKLSNPKLMISALENLNGEISHDEKNKRVYIGYQFITSSDDLLKAYEFMVEGRCIEEFEEKYPYLSDQEIDREMAQIDFIMGYINFVLHNPKP